MRLPPIAAVPDFTATPTLEAQLVRVCNHLRTILPRAGMTTDNPVHLNS